MDEAQVAEPEARPRITRGTLWLIRVAVVILFVTLFAFGVIDAELLVKLIGLL